jgi:hypothetical protein
MTKPIKASNAQTLEVPKQEGKSDAQQLADLVTTGLVSNAVTVARYSQPDMGVVSVTELLKSLTNSCESVNRNDLSQAEQVLHAQALTLNAMFGELARRAALNMGEHMAAFEAYMRLALKAQSQSRATFETLATIKNPPVVYAKQANINNGGQQQVNNGGEPPSPNAHPGKTASQPNELLEDASHGRTQLDSRAANGAGREYSELATVGEVDWPPKRRRQGEGIA